MKDVFYCCCQKNFDTNAKLGIYILFFGNFKVVKDKFVRGVIVDLIAGIVKGIPAFFIKHVIIIIRSHLKRGDSFESS